MIILYINLIQFKCDSFYDTKNVYFPIKYVYKILWIRIYPCKYIMFDILCCLTSDYYKSKLIYAVWRFTLKARFTELSCRIYIYKNQGQSDHHDAFYNDVTAA